MTRYRSDRYDMQADGSRLWYADWLGGPTLAKIEDCRIDSMAGDMRRTVVITGEADSMFSIPAECSIAGVTVKGYVTGDEAGTSLVFRHVDCFTVDVEYTDTFGGEANYCWVRRASLMLPVGTSDREVMRQAKLAVGLTHARGRTYAHGDTWEFKPYRSATILMASVRY